MLLGARQFFERRGAPTPPLPYDAEVEYLESTGTQWISTGLQFQKDIRIVLSVTYLDKNSWGRNAGSYEVFWGYSGNFWFGGGQQVITRQNNIMYNLDLDFTAGSMVGKIDGNVARTTTGTQPTETYIGLFGRWSFNGAEPSTAKMRHGGITIYQGGNTLLDWQAVRFTNEQGQSEGAMYDRANPTVGMNPDGSPRTDGLYRNQGTGAFLWAEKQ